MRRKPLKKCRYCGCTESRVCMLTITIGAKNAVEIPCWWFAKGVCSSPECVRREIAALQARKKELARSLREAVQFLEDLAKQVSRP